MHTVTLYQNVLQITFKEHTTIQGNNAQSVLIGTVRVAELMFFPSTEIQNAGWVPTLFLSGHCFGTPDPTDLEQAKAWVTYALQTWFNMLQTQNLTIQTLEDV